ncbi:polysaccharide biosynthesis protein [Maribacter sp. ANRC-HE7]|uniref:Polysaccharide biosynthesis protein n=1 Tax=Maribacter aquimaris TaxID=2737171 RepID=A0ABR7V4M1_9FLAO|nr:oligosaccharide flippase family protein [Maribacter aquimaris]MBD0778098.1 polysaccharide biosynthesis protein [Maribacter aquimaris]
MDNNHSNNKRIAKNTVMLYVRMLLMMGVAFFMTRILLKELGVEDFGIYNIVGGVVAMFTSLRGSFASATQRFLNFEMGRKNEEGLNRIFNKSIIIHLILALLLLILAETVGLWFVNNKLVINPERLSSANLVYQFSILTSLVTLLTIPFDAVIIANEKMDVYAYLSILDVLLKIGVILVLSYSVVNNPLVLYSFLVLLVSLIIRFLSSWYCKRNFRECKFKLFWDPKLFKEMGSFAGWNFLGNSAFVLTNEGTNILLNIFGGTPINAARAVAYQVRNVSTQVTSTMMMAINPQIIKQYAEKKYKPVMDLIFFSSKISFFLLFAITLPVLVYADIILKLWLEIIPEHTLIFVRLILVFVLIRVFHGPLDTLFKATGKIKKYQLIDSGILLLNLPLSYFLLKLGLEFSVVFNVMIVVEIINLICLLLLANKVANFDIKSYFTNVILPCVLVVLSTIPLVYYLLTLSNSLSTTIISILIIVIFIVFLFWGIGLNKSERNKAMKSMEKFKLKIKKR